MPLTTYLGQIFESQEEAWFAMWCEELKRQGYVNSWEKITKSWEVLPAMKILYMDSKVLKTKVKHTEKSFTLLNDLEYTADFMVDFTAKGFALFGSPMGSHKFNRDSYFFYHNTNAWADPLSYKCYVEVKPTFDQHGKTARFAILQKIIWFVKKVFVNLVITEELFRDTFMPVEAAPDFKYKIKSKAGEWKVKYTPKTLKEYVERFSGI